MEQTKPTTNEQGIPQAPFVENVEEYVGSQENVAKVLGSFQEMMQKYKYMEMSTLSRITSLNNKIPDIEKTLDMVKYLGENKGETIETNYELNETLYAKAKVVSQDTVYLWLGANVMLEYPIPEAIDLLTEKLESAQKSLTQAKNDLEFLQENITILEVNTARVHNWDVQKKKEAKA